MPKKASHWIGVKPEPDKYFGFIYLITNTLTGVKYVGRKFYWVKKRKVGCKSMPTTDRQSPKWKHDCHKESDWKGYMGSSKPLTKDIKAFGKENFTFKIIKQCRSKGTLVYSEVEAIIKSGAMSSLSEEGSDGYEYYNRSCDRIRYKVPPIYHEEEALPETYN